jgi:hypothetical protein
MGAPRPLNDPEATFSGGGFLLGDEEPGQSERQVLSRADLLARLSALVQSCEGCEHVAVIGVTPLDGPDTEGCNWSSSVVLEPAGVSPEVYVIAYAQAVAVARASWNLK